MEKRFTFTGSGGALFVQFLVGIILTVITLGIYAPWFAIKLTKFVYDNTTLSGSAKGGMRLEFRGTGGQLFVTYLVGILLTIITLGIYGPWFWAKLIKFFSDNSVARAGDGTEYKLQFNGTGGQLFVTCLVGYLLTIITLGIYGPWFAVKLMKLIAQKTAILETGHPAGNIAFVATGGQLFVTLLVGVLLTIITLGIYGAWFAVKLTKFYTENTEITVNGIRHAGTFGGTGGQFFVLNLVGYLLTIITLGIYGAWYICKIWKFKINNTAFVPR
jgi:uncharacterized membrane protein YjgN (DUF898 family)